MPLICSSEGSHIFWGLLPQSKGICLIGQAVIRGGCRGDVVSAGLLVSSYCEARSGERVCLLQGLNAVSLCRTVGHSFMSLVL